MNIAMNRAVRDVLREQTWDVHEQLHRHASFDGLLKRSLTIGGYRRLVQRMHGFYVPLDQAILQVMEQEAGPSAEFRYVPRSQFLARDLVDMGVNPNVVSAAPRCQPAERLVSPRTLGGVLYVIEGSTRGGALIDKAARELLVNQAPDGRRYWAWCRSVHRQRWAMTIRYLERLHAGGVTLDELASGARHTFQLMAEWLSPLDRPTAVAQTSAS